MKGKAFRITGALWEKSTGDRWIPQKASDSELMWFLC